MAMHIHTNDLMRYLTDEWAAKKGGEIPDADKWLIVSAVDRVPRDEMKRRRS